MLVLIGGGALFVASSRAAYETARYEVLSNDGEIELRRYAPMVVVTTALGPDDRDNGFGRLFRFISGANESNQKIAMTAPVFMPSTADGRPVTMQFVLPSEIGEAGAPKPTGSGVGLESRPGGLFAAIRFRGYGLRWDIGIRPHGKQAILRLEEIQSIPIVSRFHVRQNVTAG